MCACVCEVCMHLCVLKHSRACVCMYVCVCIQCRIPAILPIHQSSMVDVCYLCECVIGGV